MAEKIEVITYEGYRGEERPVAFVLRGERIEIVEVLERWIEEEFRERIQKRFFVIKGSDGNTLKIYQEIHTSEWYRA